MKGSVLIGLIVMAVLFVQGEVRAESIPYAEFVEVTDKALDALDDVEAIISSSEAKKRDAKQALTKLDAAIKKYDRHMTARWNLEEQQRKIIEKLQEAYSGFGLYVELGGDKKWRDNGESSAKEVRELFMVYKKSASQQKTDSNQKNKMNPPGFTGGSRI